MILQYKINKIVAKNEKMMYYFINKYRNKKRKEASIMKKISKEEAKKVVGGKRYKCQYCSFSTDSHDVMVMHYWGLHNVHWS